VNVNIFNIDFQDFIRALNECDVEYVLVGGYAVILHGYSRTTGDMDIWVNPTTDNYTRLLRAFSLFGMSIFDMSLEKFLNTTAYDVFVFGVPPVSIELMTKVKGLEFDHVLENAEWFDIDPSLKVRALGLPDLIMAKKAANRPKDLDDLAHL
jgi:predicted nucleotidyltransferase